MTPEIKPENVLMRQEASRSIKMYQEASIRYLSRDSKHETYFVMLMGYQIIQFWLFCASNFFFSFKPHKNISKLIVLAGNIVLGAPLIFFWVWLLFTNICLRIYHQDVTAIKLEAQLESFKAYFDEK